MRMMKKVKTNWSSQGMQREGGWKSMKPTKKNRIAEVSDELFEELKMEKIMEDYYLDLMAEVGERDE